MGQHTSTPGRGATVILISYWVALFMATHVPADLGSDLPLWDSWDKYAHFAGYSVLAVLLALAVSLRRPLTWAGFLAMAMVLAAYAAVDELLQLPVPGRYGSLEDWLADISGTAIGLVGFLVLQKVFRNCCNPRAVGANTRQNVTVPPEDRS